MKRLLSFLLFIVMCISVLTLSACGTKSADTTPSQSTTEETATEPLTTSSPDETNDEVLSENVGTAPSEETSPFESSNIEETVPFITAEHDADIQAVYDYAADTINSDKELDRFEVLLNTPGDDGKSRSVQYSLENDNTIYYYEATVELNSDGDWTVKENKLNSQQEKQN